MSAKKTFELFDTLDFYAFDASILCPDAEVHKGPHGTAEERNKKERTNEGQ